MMMIALTPTASRKPRLLAGAAALIAACAGAVPAPALAGSLDGKWQVKLLGTAVLPDGKIKSVRAVNVATTLGATVAPVANPQTVVSDNGAPTLAVEYFLTPAVSVETICCTTQHHVNGVDALAGANLVNDVLIIPATVTLKYHVNLGPVRPYVGVGPSVFLVVKTRPGVTASALGVTRVRLTSEVGAAFQAGVDIPLGSHGLGLSLDAKKYIMTTDAHFFQGNTEALVTHHKLNPLLLSAGLSYRF